MAAASASGPGIPPGHDEYEVTVLGPGYGECVVVHLGDNRWLTIDSCVRENATRSLALEYLESLNVDPASDVAYVVASHWHDDHVKGLAGLVRECVSAQFVCSAALRKEEFLALLEVPRAPDTKFSSGVEEFNDIVRLLGTRKHVISWGTPARRLVADPTPIVKGIWTLSPSDGDIQRALLSFATPAQRSLRRIPIWDDPNDATVVVQIELDEETVLLGGDLEHRRNSTNMGWHGVLTNPGRPTQPAGIFKVAHHGSITSHCKAMWDIPCRKKVNHAPAMLRANETISIIAPWRLGNHTLPTDDDVERLTALSGSVHLTAQPDDALGQPSHANRYQATMLARSMLPLTQRPGGVTCRRKAGATGWSITQTTL